jgi:hypothetical protein
METLCVSQFLTEISIHSLTQALAKALAQGTSGNLSICPLSKGMKRKLKYINLSFLAKK